jgi:hypothetical protein
MTVAGRKNEKLACRWSTTMRVGFSNLRVAPPIAYGVAWQARTPFKGLGVTLQRAALEAILVLRKALPEAAPETR